MMFTAAQQTAIDALIKRRFARERELFERAMQALHARHAADIAALQSEIVRLKSERDTAQRLANRWFKVRPCGPDTPAPHDH